MMRATGRQGDVLDAWVLRALEPPVRRSKAARREVPQPVRERLTQKASRVVIFK